MRDAQGARLHAGVALMDEIVDQNDATRSAIEALLPKAVAELQEQIDNGGMRSVRLTCKSCGAKVTEDVRVADADLLVKAVTALSSALPRMAPKDDAKGARVTKILADLSGMTSAELAAYIVQLEALHGQDDNPD
jgi:hypothetical protein